MTRVTRNTCLFLLLAFGLLLAGVLGIAYLNDKEVRVSLAQDSRWIRDDITALMLRYELGLHGTRGAILAIGPDEMTRERFLRYTESRDVSQEFPWANGFGFIRTISAMWKAPCRRPWPAPASTSPSSVWYAAMAVCATYRRARMWSAMAWARRCG